MTKPICLALLLLTGCEASRAELAAVLGEVDRIEREKQRLERKIEHLEKLSR